MQLHAWIFRPTTGAGPYPAITMAHGFSGLKYRGLQAYAECFAEAGFLVVVHDHRNFGRSGGAVRGDIDPWQQIADWRRAISYIEALPNVDASRIGVWGTSYAGGHSLVLGATDSRIRAVVAQVPIISGYEQIRRGVPAEMRPAMDELFNKDDRAQLRGELPMRQLVVSTDTSVHATSRSQPWANFQDAFQIPSDIEDSKYITVRSSRLAQLYEPGVWISRIGPKPLLMVVAENDAITPIDLALGAYERAVEPKRLKLIKGGHFDAYLGSFKESSSAARDWFVEHLQSACPLGIDADD